MWIEAAAAFEQSLAALPLTSYEADPQEGQCCNHGIEIARVSEPGAVFGEISALLDCPHTADVRALASSQFHVVDPAALQDPAALFYVATILARRIDGANQALVALKSEIHEKPRSVIEIAIKRMERLLSASGANFPHDGYSYNSRA